MPKAKESRSRMAKVMHLRPPAKGGSKGQSKQADANRCNYCGGYGHWKRDCRKFQADKASGQVRQVENDETSQRAASSPSSTGTGTAQHSPSATSYRSGNVNRVAFNDSTVIIEDLTEFSESPGHGHSSLRMVQACSLQFDMSSTDDDNMWTCAPGCQADFPVRNHVRMMSVAGEPSSEIILDSGADTSALPLSCADVGESCHGVGLQDYVDAQGGIWISEIHA